MGYSGSQFMDQAAPVAEFFRAVNTGYELTYEWDKHDYAEGGIAAAEGEGAPRTEWGLDLSRIRSRYGNWGGSVEAIQDHVLYHVISNARENTTELEQFFEGRATPERRQAASRNISNAWRDEYTLNDPLGANTDARMRTAEWRITTCYYAIFKATSALMRACFDNIRNDGGDSHSGVWIKHRIEMMSELGNSLYAFPFMYFPQATTGEHADNWFDWTVPYPIQEEFEQEQEEILKEKAEGALRTLCNRARTVDWTGDHALNTFYDSMLLLRHWANYQDGGIFCRLYGEGYKQAIDDALRLLAFTGVTIAEVGLIFVLGWRQFLSIYQTYMSSCVAGVSDANDLVLRRVRVYREVFG